MIGIRVSKYGARSRADVREILQPEIHKICKYQLSEFLGFHCSGNRVTGTHPDSRPNAMLDKWRHLWKVNCFQFLRVYTFLGILVITEQPMQQCHEPTTTSSTCYDNQFAGILSQVLGPILLPWLNLVSIESIHKEICIP